MQRQEFDIGKAPAQSPPTQSPRVGATVRGRDAEGHVRGVAASSRGLIRATLGSAAAAGAILVLFWLPAEYGIDATGLGRAMGLTRMGEIKQQLHAEAAADDAALAAAPAPAAQAAADPQLLARLEAIETQVAAIATVVGAAGGAGTAAGAPTAPAAVPPEAAATPQSQAVAVPASPAVPAWRDSWSITLDPGEGIEAKLRMQKGEQAEFAWTANGAALSHDMHGDGGGQEISYEKGRDVPGQEGILTAAFTGNHGWFWRNRSDAPVTMTLNVRGAYERLLTP